MKVAEPCPICQDLAPCQCSLSVQRFFALLSDVDERVLTQKPSSNSAPEVVSSGIDKLHAQLRHPITSSQLKARCKELGLAIKERRLRDKRLYSAVKISGSEIYFGLSPDRSFINRLTSNPNKFKTWDRYVSILHNLLPSESMESLHLTRLDLNLDLSIPFPELLQSLDIKNKRDSISFTDESGVRTGAIVGKGTHTIAIYDKALKDKRDTPLSRIEVRISGKHLKQKSIHHVPNIALLNDHFGPLLGVNLTRLPQTVPASKEKIDIFLATCQRDGLYLARKQYNSNRNFDRDFSKLLTIEPWSKQPTDLFLNHIQKFFTNERTFSWMNQTEESKQVH